MNRGSQRAAYEIPVRLSLIESDLDQHEYEIHELTDAVNRLNTTMNDRLTKILWAVVSLALSIATAAISFALAGGGG